MNHATHECAYVPYMSHVTHKSCHLYESCHTWVTAPTNVHTSFIWVMSPHNNMRVIRHICTYRYDICVTWVRGDATRHELILIRQRATQRTNAHASDHIHKSFFIYIGLFSNTMVSFHIQWSPWPVRYTFLEDSALLNVLWGGYD